MEETIARLAYEIGIPKSDVWRVYVAFWRYIKETIANFPFDKDLTKEEFDKLRASFSVPFMGKLNCTYDNYRRIRQYFKNKDNEAYVEDKNDKADVQPSVDNSRTV